MGLLAFQDQLGPPVYLVPQAQKVILVFLESQVSQAQLLLQVIPE